jgi:holo-[acyl-carrier protein] synthase
MMRSSSALDIRVGVDIVQVERLIRLIEDHPDAPETLFTERELAYCSSKRRRYDHLAARFAAKEAVFKACGTGLALRMRWTDVEVVNDPSGRPRLDLHGEVASSADRQGLRQWDVSLSHTGGFAIAQVIAVRSSPFALPSPNSE